MRKPFDEIFLQDVFSLPTRDGGDPGGALERTMLERAGGAAGIVRVEESDVDGTVTRLYTRDGFPVFETEQTRSSARSVILRGFVARAVPGGRAVLFNPYTLVVLDANYSPAKNTYSVQNFATKWNVPVGDTTDWYDVMLFDGSTIKVNAKAMPTLGITSNHAFPAIPYCINRNDASDQYGNAERNQTEKRVFAVGRADVKAWGGGSGTIETLTPLTPRYESRAMTVGQRCDPNTNTAWLGQLFYSGDSWDSIVSEWGFSTAQVNMLLTSAYLIKTSVVANVTMPVAGMIDQGVSTTGSISTGTTLPATEIALFSVGANGLTIPYTSNSSGGAGNNGTYSCHYDWSGTVSKPLEGVVNASYSGRVTYAGSSSSSESQAGTNLSYSEVNSKTWDARIESTSTATQSVPLYTPDTSGVSNYNGSNMTGDHDHLYWGQYFTSPITTGLNASGPGANRGTPNKDISGESISGSTCARNYEEQSATFSVQIGSDKLVDGSFSRNKSSGQKAVFTPNPSTYYAAVIATVSSDPTGVYRYNISSGMGIYNGPVIFNAYSDPATSETWIRYYKGNFVGGQYNWYENPAGVDDINSKYSNMRDQFAAQTCYDSENSDGYTTSSARGGPYYTSSISPSVDLLSQTLEWSTKDFILHDTTNGVYISINGAFSGIDTDATLTVTLTVHTRHHANTITLAQRNYTYTELLPETEIGTTGKYAVPSPQIRAIFAPLYQEQGSFKGAHYVTADEEANGAAAFHGFDFLLYLRSYGDLGTLNDDNESGTAVYFVPCNLLEMLYAIVFSQEYGVGTTRYPVTYTTRYNDLMGTLFANPVRVSIRDGVSSLWTNAFGSDFSATSTISLHRA